MNREIHVRICESLRGQFPRATRPSPEPISVKMEGGQRMEDETLFSRNAGMGSQTDDAAVQSCGHRAGGGDGYHDGDATRLAAQRKTD